MSPLSKNTDPTHDDKGTTADKLHDGDVILFTLKGKDFFGVARNVDLDYDETKVYVYFGFGISRTELPRKHPITITGKLSTFAMYHMFNPLATVETGVLHAN